MWKKYCRMGQGTDVSIRVIRRTRIACWITAATDTHSEYVMTYWCSTPVTVAARYVTPCVNARLPVDSRAATWTSWCLRINRAPFFSSWPQNWEKKRVWNVAVLTCLTFWPALIAMFFPSPRCFIQDDGKCRLIQWRTKEDGVWSVQTPPRNSEGPPISCQTQPDCENC